MDEYTYLTDTSAYVFGMNLEKDGVLYSVKTQETDPNREFKIYAENYKPKNPIVKINRNLKLFLENRFATIEFIREHKPEDAERIKAEIKSDEEHNKSKKELHDLLKSLGLEFRIDPYYYKEEHDYLDVIYKGKTIFSGYTEELATKNRSTLFEKENNNE